MVIRRVGASRRWSIAMSGLLYTLLGLAASSSLHCAVRREISPCTCRQEKFSTPVLTHAVSEASTLVPSALISSVPSGNANSDASTSGSGGGGASSDDGGGFNNPRRIPDKILVMCEKMESFSQISAALKDRFDENQHITLKVQHSQLKDIAKHNFAELHMFISRLDLSHDDLSVMHSDVFSGLSEIQYLSLSDNEIPFIPRDILSHLPQIRTLDLSRNRLTRVDADDFKNNPSLQHLLLAGNAISEMMPGSLPLQVKNLHVGRNRLNTLNKTLCGLYELQWLFINSNELTSLDEELPTSDENGQHNLRMLHAMDNKLTHLPPEFLKLHRLEMLFLQHNNIRSLEGKLKNARNLKKLELSYNNLQEITEEDFMEAGMLEELELGHNSLKSLGSSTSTGGSSSALWPLRSLKSLNLTHNNLTEFSFAYLRGLNELRLIDLSNNNISRLCRGPTENLVDEEGHETPGASVQELRLQHNSLSTLEDSLFVGMRELQRLNLSHNAFGPSIGAKDFRGLDNLRNLDLSHNQLTSLEDISEAYLPVLEELNASHNRLVTLSERDFRGFPVLCWADLSMNQIRSLTPDLVSHTRCTVHGVPDIFRIYLQDNPVLCSVELVDLTVDWQVRDAKVYGVANNCSTTKQTPLLAAPSSSYYYASPTVVASGNISFAATLE